MKIGQFYLERNLGQWTGLRDFSRKDQILQMSFCLGEHQVYKGGAEYTLY